MSDSEERVREIEERLKGVTDSAAADLHFLVWRVRELEADVEQLRGQNEDLMCSNSALTNMPEAYREERYKLRDWQTRAAEQLQLAVDFCPNPDAIHPCELCDQRKQLLAEAKPAES